jgi:hypothetical protein
MNNFYDTGVTGSPLSGTLRVSRTGNKVEGFFWNGAGWESMGSITSEILGARVGVMMAIGPYANGYSGIPAKAAFDHIRINYTTLGPGFGGNPSGPAVMELLLLN